MKNYQGFFIITEVWKYENPLQFDIDLVWNYSLMESFCYQMESS